MFIWHTYMLIILFSQHICEAISVGVINLKLQWRNWHQSTVKWQMQGYLDLLQSSLELKSSDLEPSTFCITTHHKLKTYDK
jgi:hypothetical protein